MALPWEYMLWCVVMPPSSLHHYMSLWPEVICVQLAVLSLANNSLSGPAFPPAWLEPEALPRLIVLDVAGNPGLGGTLPANLSWPFIDAL